MATDTPRIPEQGVATLPDEAWERARRRAEIISPLAQSETVGHEAADMAAQALGLSRRQVYVLIRRARQGSGLVTDLVPGQSGGGKGKGRLPEPVERVIHELLQKRFLTKQKRSLAAFHREVTQVCKAQKLRVPARNTVALRIASLDPRKVIRRREGQDAARDLQGVGGEPPAVTAPLEQVQIDHTVIDLIVVDDRDRQPIGRPYLTLAIDVFTRCVLGMVVTLEAPSAVSVGLCLVHVACDKRPWLEGLNVEMDWQMSGKPLLLYLDNAAEFKSEALRRGCEQHGIRLDYRPLGQPHYGGIVERIIGTAMQMIHDELPGTTFSNPDQAEHLVAFSCKRRGFCPSCGARRMAESAALLVDEVLPEQPMRQWVLSFPFQLRFLFGVVCGKGRNPTLRLWPAIFSGEIDVFPGDRRSRLIWHCCK